MKNTVKRDHCAKKTTDKKVSKSLLNIPSSAERVRLWHLLHAIGQHFERFKVSVDHLEIKRWKDQPLRQQFGRFSISLPMRFFFLALEEKIHQQDGWTLGFLTVNFSQALTDKLTNDKTRALAGNYANRLNNKFRKHGIRSQWFGVLEDQKGNLHCHGLIGFHKDDETKIKQCLKADTDMNSGIRLQETYRSRRRKRTTLFDQTLITAHLFLPELLQEANVDIGAADYMSKALEKMSNYMDTGKCRIYAPNELRSAAETLYENMRKKQNCFQSAAFDTSTLSSHQALTYMLKGWIPKAVTADEARLDEQHMADIENALAWEHFRNSEPEYDWQYEEDAPSVDACFEAKQERAEGLLESEYDHVAEEAEHHTAQSSGIEEMTEGEYGWLMSEIAVFNKEHEKDRSLSEGQYEVLMQEISNDLEQYHQEQLSWQAPTDPEVSDADIDAFLEQQMLSGSENGSASSNQRRYFQPQSMAGKTARLALSAGNTSLKQPFMIQQVTRTSGARHPPLSTHRSPPCGLQTARLRRSIALGIPAYRRKNRTPLSVPRGVLTHCQHYQKSRVVTEWPPPAIPW
ncbi:hypothetical protein ACLUEY_14070 [Vreelandella aquamarina]